MKSMRSLENTQIDTEAYPMIKALIINILIKNFSIIFLGYPHLTLKDNKKLILEALT